MNRQLRPRHAIARLLGLLVIAGCAGGPAAPTAVPPTATALPTAPPATPAATPAPAGPTPYVLAASGPYHVGIRGLDLEDGSREGREVSVTVWYPAVPPSGAAAGGYARDADPDPKGAPYPLILSSTKMATVFAPTLVSHGFTWASVDNLDTYRSTNPEMLHQPLDILFALDQVAANPPPGLEGMIDPEHAGATGYSFDGFNALMLGGARIDPEHYLPLCADPERSQQAVGYWFVGSYNCGLAGQWDSFSAAAGEALTTSQDGLWQPVTDVRIRAVLPMAPDGFYLFGEKGLAAVDRPVLLIDATKDDLYRENVLIFEHLGTPDKALISFVGPTHMMIFDSGMVARMAHFAVAFFGYHLQGRQDLAQYFSEDFVAQHDDLVWGVYPGE